MVASKGHAMEWDAIAVEEADRLASMCPTCLQSPGDPCRRGSAVLPEPHRSRLLDLIDRDGSIPEVVWA